VNSLLNAGVQPIMRAIQSWTQPFRFIAQNYIRKYGTYFVIFRNRVKYRKKAKEFLIQGNVQGARECFQRSTEVTSQMALDVVKVGHCLYIQLCSDTMTWFIWLIHTLKILFRHVGG